MTVGEIDRHTVKKNTCDQFKYFFQLPRGCALHTADRHTMAFSLTRAQVTTLKQKLAHVTSSVDTELAAIVQQELDAHGHNGVNIVRQRVVRKVDELLATTLLSTMITHYGRFKLTNPACQPIRKLLRDAGINTCAQWDAIRLGRSRVTAKDVATGACGRARRRGSKPVRWVPPEGPAGKWSSVSPTITKQKQSPNKTRARSRDSPTKSHGTPAAGDTAVVEWLIEGKQQVFFAMIESGGVCRFEDGTVEPWKSCARARNRVFRQGAAVPVRYRNGSRNTWGTFSGVFADGMAFMTNGEAVQVESVDWFDSK